MKSLHLICVGKLKDPHFEAIENDYLKRINNPPLIIHEVKASAENKESEAEALFKKMKKLGEGGLHRVALSEWGKKYPSVEFARYTEKLIEKPGKVVFLIAGAQGFHPSVLEACQDKLSLSDLTFPHKIARILLVEQLYRAQTLRIGHPYHN